MLVARAARHGALAAARPALLQTRRPALLLQHQRNISSFRSMDTPVNLGIVIVPQQTAYVVERFGRFDKVQISIDGVLFVKVTDAKMAAYGVEDPHFAIT